MSASFETSTYVFPGAPPATPPRARHVSRHSASVSNYAPVAPTYYRFPSVSNPPSPQPSNQRFSNILNTVLGSPFLTTSDSDYLPEFDLIDGALQAVPRTHTITRPSSPSPTADFSIIGQEEIESDLFTSPYSYPMRSSSTFGFSPRRALYSSPSLGSPFVPNNSSTQGCSSPGTFKAFLPRLWDVLSSPGRNVLNSSSPRSALFTASGNRHTLYGYNHSNPSPGRKGKGKLTTATMYDPNFYDSEGYINYSDLPPLDGEEGELIDDEACFIDVRAVTGIDILSLLPPELSIYILSLLCTPDALSSIFACLCVSHTWRKLANDNAVWRALFLGRWGVDLRRAGRMERTRLQGTAQSAEIPRLPQRMKGGEWGRRSATVGASDMEFRAKKLPALPPRSASMSSLASKIPVIRAPLILDWKVLYKERMELDKRWDGTACNAPSSLNTVGNAFEPKVMRISGHTDSVYCLEFDSSRIITGSRDRTIKVWSLKTGKLLGTFWGVHRGSVLCLKFVGDWEDAEVTKGSEIQDEPLGNGRKGFMVSGSSDCSICVWDLCSVPPLPGQAEEIGGVKEREVQANVRAVLKGHVGGVLDLRIDERWIVSCSKDAVIRVWDRGTLALHRTLRGHEGPVNAVGLQSGRVVSASGDGKMILWDIESGERLRTFEGHDRGLACIEFKDDLIVSGSNDCKIKIWSASTGECLKTLVGHEALVRALSFDPRNGRLVSASYDKSVKLWDLGTGKMVREFKNAHTSHIFDVKFDVARIVSTSHDQKIVVLDFSHGLDASLFI